MPRSSTRSTIATPHCRRYQLRGLGVSPNEALMVGDSLVADVEGALGAGLNAVLLDRHDDHPDLAPRIRSLDELRP